MKTQKVYFLKGLPASGKSSWAREKIEEDRMNGIVTKRVNKDELRAMIDNSNHSKEREWFVNKTQSNIISDALDDGYNVIVDNTNFYPKHREELNMIIHHMKHEHPDRKFEVVEKFFDISLVECISRDKNRDKPVGEKVIRDMYNKYLAKERVATIPHNPKLMDCIAVDIDGTLAIRGDRSPYDYFKAHEDELNVPVANLVYNLQQSNPKLVTVIVTARENVCDEDGYTILDLTSDWLTKNHVHFDDIHIRKEKDKRPDWQVKEELYREGIMPYYNVLYWIDDRKQVIDHMRDIGLTVLDVAGHNF